MKIEELKTGYSLSKKENAELEYSPPRMDFSH